MHITYIDLAVDACYGGNNIILLKKIYFKNWIELSKQYITGVKEISLTCKSTIMDWFPLSNKCNDNP